MSASGLPVVAGSIFVLFVDNDVAFADAAARSFESVGMILMSVHPGLLRQDITSPSTVSCKPLEIAELCRAIRVRQTQ
jgi:hypothetical protein